jgi:cellulose synthase/poly-beta-1,6-N-acetylglucosamine synthase-like glycosyltransferase
MLDAIKMSLELTTVAIVLLCIAGISLLVLFFYYVYFFTNLKKHSLSESGSQPISVVIAARNERPNLEKNLPAILNQDYPDFEVVLVNDGSWDGTKDYLKELALTNPRLKIVTIELDEKFQKGKKFALTMGIKAASYENLLFTDADCKPTTNRWIACMAHHLETNKVVLGNSPLVVRNTPLGSMVNYETFHTAIQYLGYAKRGFPYMGVGRNLAYTKSLFFENKGFASHQHIMSGDDDLFVQEVTTFENTAVCLDPDSFTHSNGPSGIKDWLKQKTRHLSTGNLYLSKFKFLLGIYSLFQLLVYVAAITLFIIYPQMWYLGAGVLLLKWVVQWIVMYGPSKRLGYTKVGYALPYYDILYTLYLLFFGFAKPCLKPKSWN